MKFIGIWWGMHIKRYTWSAGPDHGATTARAKEYIDFAAAHGIGGVLAEGWNKGWETWASGQVPLQDFCTAYPDFDLEEVVRYAKEKNVIFISHHETGGNIPEYERQLESALALCRSHGITALKTGYAGPILPKGYHHHGQYMVRHFQKVVELAAKYHIMLDVHESIKPTGLDRTWPNLMTQEGARGNEWNATYKATPPYHATILPFTRFLAGPYDYTPGIFKIVHSPESNKRLYCTRTYQLAMFVVYYSPLMMVSDMIENYEGQAGLRFIEEVPCNWDETRVPAAHPGDYVCIARREKDRWFVGTITDEQCRLIKIPMSFLKSGQRYLATIYGDSISTDWENLPEAMEIGHYVVTADDTICAALSKAGGNAVMITPLGNDRLKDYLAISTYNREAENKMKVFRTRKTYGDLHIEHLALKKPLKLKESYSERYPASGKQALTDGERGSYNFSAGGWQGFEGCDMEATIDLQELKKIHSITAGFLSSVNDWIFFPTTVTFYYSKNGSDYIKAGEKYLSNNKRDEKTVSIKDLSVQFDEVSARYVKVAAKSIGTCPSWHYGKGGKAWLFCDEIMVN
jgi:alpha-glucosidase